MSLTAEEREIILTWNDADQSWSIYSDSRTLGTVLRRWLEKVGVEVKRTQHGFEAEGIPRGAISFLARRRVLTDEHRARLREGLRRSRAHSRTPQVPPKSSSVET